MTDEINSLNELAERLFTKPPALQGVNGLAVARYVNACVDDIEEGLVRQLLNMELCTSERDLKEFNEYVTTGSLLHLLAFVGRHEAAEWLLRNGAHVHSRTHGGSTPLHVAALRYHSDTIKVLRFHHGDVYAENKEKKNALDLGQGADDVKESLLANRFGSEVLEEEYLRDCLPMMVEKIKSKDTGTEDLLQNLLSLRAEIRSSTSSMTSVPKPLKLLREHYTQLKEVYLNTSTSKEEIRAVLADVLSVLAVTVEDKDRDCLHFRLAGSRERISSFGHPYIRRVCTQIPEEWTVLSNPEDSLHGLVVDIASYCLLHSAETEACDVLMEIEQIDLIVSLVTTETYSRVCLYLSSCVKYVPEPEDSILLNTTIKIYLKFQQYPQALRLAMMLNDHQLIKKIFNECHNSVVRKQLAFMLGRQQMFLELDDDCSDADDITEIMSNVHLNTNFLNLARELDIMEPKVPEDIYKTHLEHARFSSANTVDSARANLASSLVNGLVNAGFGQDKLLTNDGNKWLYKNKGCGMMSAAASLGLVLLWDVEGGLTQIDKFLYSTEDYIKSGALLACGIVNCGVRNECDPALALLSDYVVHQSNTMRLGAIIGLGLAYAGSSREDVIQLLTPVLMDPSSSLEVLCMAALSCGMVAVGSCHDELTQTLLLIMTKKESAELVKTHCRYLALALGLLHLGKPAGISIFLEVLKTVPEPFRSFASTMLEICAYVGSGAVLKIQDLLHICSEHYGDKSTTDQSSTNGKPGDKATDKGTEEEAKKEQKPDKDNKGEEKAEEKSDPDLMGSIAEPGSHQGLAVLGIALIAMGEDIGGEMSLRTFNHLLHYGEPVIRRAVPLALALLSTSHPQLSILDTLSKFSHDNDSMVARNAIFSMGLVGSGTNNARLAGMLRNLAQFYHKDPLDLFVVRLAQGLTHLGKGTLTLNPYHSDRMLMSPVVVAGLLTVAVSMLDHSNNILGDPSYMLFYLTPAIQPRMLVTFNADLEPLTVTVRVGQAVDVVGQAGKPKSITGFQTHTTPVLLAYGERAELATEEYVPLTPILEGFVILEKNPNYVEG